MKPLKRGPPVPDQSVRPNDLLTGTEHDFTGKVEDWEERVFRAAHKTGYFNLCTPVSPGKVNTKRYAWFCSAALAAWDNPRAMVYAVTRTGRHFCIPRQQWGHYCNIERELVS